MTPDRFRPDYLDALYEQPAITVGAVVIRRLGLGGHFRLQALGERIVDAPLEDRVGWFRLWLEAAGVDTDEVLLSDLPVICQAIRALNASRGRFAWDEISSNERKEQRTDYPGRALARIVDLLARNYGWSLDQIINLPPEVAIAHAQECILADRRQREWEHYLSEMAWEYDKGAKVSRYKPLPPLAWDRPEPERHEPVPQWIKDKYYPKGVIIDLTKSD